MKTHYFPYIALGSGLFLLLVVSVGNKTGTEGETILPLLTLLIVSEFSFFITAIGVCIGVRHSLAFGKNPIYIFVTAGCALLALRFIFLGIELWPY